MRRGFTLIELLVVITILAVLAGAALPYVQSYVEESKIAKAKTDLEEIARALAVYETREGDYSKADVSDITGRYLNKAPIDPWGKSYIVGTDSGTVFSSGPDRASGTLQDNIVVPFQPPLALVQVKWVDRNQTGAVDNQNASDQVQLIFSRRIKQLESHFTVAGRLNDIFNLSCNLMETAFNNATATLLASRTLVLDVQGAGVFTPGSDTISLKASALVANKLQDQANSYALTGQSVIINPQ